jgi:hypothetical protein
VRVEQEDIMQTGKLIVMGALLASLLAACESPGQATDNGTGSANGVAAVSSAPADDTGQTQDQDQDQDQSRGG